MPTKNRQELTSVVLGDMAPSLSAATLLIETTGVFPGLISPLRRGSGSFTSGSTPGTGSLILQLLLRSPTLDKKFQNFVI